jgi:hypothetical protein
MDETETIGLEMRTGRIRADVSAPTGNKTDFTVKTPMTTASVRGPSFYIDPMNIRVNNGTVRYETLAGMGRASKVQVYAGQNTWLDSDTGKTVNPMQAAEISRTLPDLAGQSTNTGTETSSEKLDIAFGNFGVQFSLNDGK